MSQNDTSPQGKHTCLIYQPLGMSFTEFRDLLPEKKFPKDLVQRSIRLILISLAFMYENNVTHTGKDTISGQLRSSAQYS